MLNTELPIDEKKKKCARTVNTFKNRLDKYFNSKIYKTEFES